MLKEEIFELGVVVRESGDVVVVMLALSGVVIGLGICDEFRGNVFKKFVSCGIELFIEEIIFEGKTKFGFLRFFR